MPLQISYGSYQFHATGVPHYGLSVQAEAQNTPLKSTLTYKVKHCFYEASFADNEARLAALKAALVPRAVLLIKDENGTELCNIECRVAGLDVPEDWGQYKREVTVSFECFSNAITGGMAAAFTPQGGSPISLPNVSAWSGGVKTDRYSEQAANRRMSTETVSASGRVLVDPAWSAAAKRDYLLAQKAVIEGIAQCPDGLLVFGSNFSKTMKVEEIRADLGDAQEELLWSFTANRMEFPDGNYAEADYEVDFGDARQQGERTVTVSGKVLAATLALAEAKADEIKGLFTSGRIFQTQNLRHREISGEDGDKALELTFNYRFIEQLDVLSYELKIGTRTDHKSGDVLTVYSGKVHALNSATAIEKARALGLGKLPFLTEMSEDVNSTGIDEDEFFAAVDFSYSYLGKSAVKFAEVAVETAAERFGVNGYSVSGSVTALDEAAARAFARSFKVTGRVVRSEKETVSSAWRENVGRLNRLDFAYVYETAPVAASISYGIDTDNDFKERETTVTIQGTAWGPNELACLAIIATVTVAPAGGRITRSRTGKAIDTTTEGTLLKEISFSVSYAVALSVNDSADILDAEYAVETQYPVLKAQIDEIPYGAPFVQAAVTTTVGQIHVSGSVTAITQASAESWATGKKSLATGYLDVCNIHTTRKFRPFSGTVIKAYSVSFAFSSRSTGLTVGGP